ncbi:tRNA (adenosine(37)-N6)-threonylcarbamoyltransferase complex dimerization subunit type 1 TsaB [Dyadobacter sandarakinus]|uniref:tRNA (Adenosine(37)-N6)-threonylcarbamoyltransferase complex dimerization subunit type 1 TsaB n=1 Tax=Dyadobacter sandarakinus TaxID=2747268 RepID=A0ABX7IAE6_9BACT|nr:tRNA (adenosine(37)-N6)-threonylcarbamoyltransferase complex dimerization subunit type 1 TsaB [Dyadobacter sandarakinus]QRR02909.1 tRNA (adenosine(37)-N6)-threonylcarbamoyltransferase complex dimerization subunit type 1 TsaB [Dyadobacter sandarakinus]
MLLLSIDTSTRGCSVALHDGDVLLALSELYTDKSSSAMLTTLIERIVAQSRYLLRDLDAIAVAKGPGSYTGLRVGVSTAKGLCYALDKPLIAINTLEAMAFQLQGFYPDSLLCPMIDARRMEVYTAVFNERNEMVQPTNAVILTDQSFEEYLSHSRMVFFGDGAAKFKSLMNDKENAFFPSKLIQPSAATVGLLAAGSFQNGIFEDTAMFEPYYLKDFMSLSARKTGSLV